MGRHYANDNWLNEMAKTDEYACRDLATKVDEMTDGRQTYNAVFGFLPGGTSTRPRNVSIASLMKLYSSRSGRKDEARTKYAIVFITKIIRFKRKSYGYSWPARSATDCSAI